MTYVALGTGKNRVHSTGKEPGLTSQQFLASVCFEGTSITVSGTRRLDKRQEPQARTRNGEAGRAPNKQLSAAQPAEWIQVCGVDLPKHRVLHRIDKD